MGKQMRFNAFDMTSAMHNAHGLWKHPDNQRPMRYKDLDYWVEIAKLLERGIFDAIFLADVIGVYDVYQQSMDASIRDGVQVPLIDPAFVIPAMANATEHLSFAVTSSTTYDQPFSHARKFSTLDHLTKGRVAWNVVTSYLPNAARNFGLDTMIKHDKRYDLADEFLDVCYKLWEGSWEDESVIRNVLSKTYVDPAKVHKINHSGKYFSVEGPHLSEPSLQRTPVMYQAGTSERGREFAARHAECVFVGGPTTEKLRFYIQDIKNKAEKFGRNPEDIKAFTFLSVIVAETNEEAEQKYNCFAQLWSADAAKAQYGGSSGYDLSQYNDLDGYFEYKHTEHGQSRAASLTKHAPQKLTVREILTKFESLNRKNILIGNPSEVADAIQVYFEETGVDGFNVAPFLSPGCFRGFY
jgi:FMN-dependent oxidoreductase (nitrilotriacetate monooxygenase family)